MATRNSLRRWAFIACLLIAAMCGGEGYPKEQPQNSPVFQHSAEPPLAADSSAIAVNLTQNSSLSIDELLEELARLQTKKTELESQEASIRQELSVKLNVLQTRLQRLGVTPSTVAPTNLNPK